jgi:hypothetical protein
VTTPSPGAPEHAAVLALTMNAVIARALYAVVDLRVPDLLADTALTAAEIGAKTDRRPDPLHRVLRTLAGAGYFTEEGDRFGLTALGRTLVTGHPTAARDLVVTLVGPAANGALSQLDATLRTGRSGTEEAFGETISSTSRRTRPKASRSAARWSPFTAPNRRP